MNRNYIYICILVLGCFLVKPNLTSASTFRVTAGGYGGDDGSLALYLSHDLNGAAEYRLLFDNLSTSYAQTSHGGLTYFSVPRLHGVVQHWNGSTWQAGSEVVAVSLQGGTQPAHFHQESVYNSFYYLTDQSDYDDYGIDHRSTGSLSLCFGESCSLSLNTSLDFNLKYASVSSASSASVQRQYRGVFNGVDLIQFSTILGNLAHWEGDVFKTWLQALGTINYHGSSYHLRGDLHLYGQASSEVPEPSSLILLTSAGAAVFTRKRRKTSYQ